MDNQRNQPQTASELVQAVVQLRLAMYEAKEHYESVLKNYNDGVAALCQYIVKQEQIINTLNIKLENKKPEVKKPVKKKGK